MIFAVVFTCCLVHFVAFVCLRLDFKSLSLISTAQYDNMTFKWNDTKKMFELLCFYFISFSHIKSSVEDNGLSTWIIDNQYLSLSLSIYLCVIYKYIQMYVPSASMCNILLAETSRRIQCNAMWTCSVHTIKADNNNNNNNNSNSTSNAHNSVEAQHGTARYNRAENSTESNVIGAHSDTKWRKAPTITANSNSNSRKFQQQCDDNKSDRCSVADLQQNECCESEPMGIEWREIYVIWFRKINVEFIQIE